MHHHNIYIPAVAVAPGLGDTLTPHGQQSPLASDPWNPEYAQMFPSSLRLEAMAKTLNDLEVNLNIPQSQGR